MNQLEAVDPEVAAALKDELARQALTIELVAATNFTSRAVLEVQGSVLAHKTLEGYPGRRYHGGHRNVDVIERLGIERAKTLFGAEYANVQPHSGVSANTAVYFAVLEPGDGMLGMDLATGGHLSHGHSASFSGRFYRASFYGVDRGSELIDYDEVLAIASAERPKMIVCGGSAYPRAIDFARFRQIADEVGAYLLADVAHFAGLIAGGAYPSPVPFADFVTFTTYKTFRGSRGGVILCREEFGRKIDAAVFPGVQGSMHVHLMAGKAVTFRLAMTEEFRDYARQVVANARALADALQERGYRIVAGGTDSHIVLVDLRSKNVTGKQAQEILETVGIVTNMNRIPYDPLGANVTSGIRLGSSAMTTRGFREAEMEETADLIDTVLSEPSDEKTLEQVRQRVRGLCLRFPLYLDPWEMGAASA
ncbi:MAG: serine hydroxymethyltransferase [Anaerolineae bacterium SM23_84]|nr:MAG: serine hydroxymethyltransferase [Anaerolineae bacterium SM23_84]